MAEHDHGEAPVQTREGLMIGVALRSNAPPAARPNSSNGAQTLLSRWRTLAPGIWRHVLCQRSSLEEPSKA